MEKSQKGLTAEGVVSVKNAAALAGIGDALCFSKVLKGEMRKSPKAYMEELGAEAKFLALK